MSPRRKKKSSRNQTAIILIVALLALLVYLLLRWNERQRLKFVRHEAYGISIPDGFKIHGIDVSRYQQFIGWDEVKKMNVENISMNFAFIKATEGENYLDPFFKRNWNKAQENKMTRGAYHFFLPDKDAVKQARFFIATVKLQKGDLPPVLDIEKLNRTKPAALKTSIKTWLQMIEDHFHVKPIIYTNADFYKKYLGSDFDEYPLWVAHYYEPHRPRIFRSWNFWQHSDKGNINGINHKVDFNVFNGDSADFSDLLIK
jgi:lysozyme